MTESTETSLAERLQAWARGSLPYMAAVEFVIATGTDVTAMVRDDGERAWLDVFEFDDDEWSSRVGWMSGGQRATWELVRSIVDGELDEWFWRLDGHRKSALLNALAHYAA